MPSKWNLWLNPAAGVWWLSKWVAYLFVVLGFAASVFVIAHREEMKSIVQFQNLRPVDPLPEAKRLAEAGLVCDAIEYLDYFLEHDYGQQNPEIIRFATELREKRDSWTFRGVDVLSGIFMGKGACLESMVSAVAADFFVVGDIRDLVLETNKWLQGESVDEFTVGLASIGVLLTGVTTVASGTTAPVKGTVSLLKLAKNLDKLPKSFQRSLLALFREAKALKTLKPLESATTSLATMAKTPGVRTRDMLEILARCENVSDLKFMENVAAAYGKNTAKFLTLGGKESLEVVRKFGDAPKVVEAMHEAVQYGPEGARLLAKTGPDTFLRYTKIAKYGSRAVRTTYQERLTFLLTRLVKLLPDWMLFAIAGVTGIVTLSVPLWKAKRLFLDRTLSLFYPFLIS